MIQYIDFLSLTKLGSIIIFMGFTNSKQEKALMQARRIRLNLYERVQKCKRMYNAAFSQINQELKKKILTSSAIQISDMIDNREVKTIEVLYIFIERTINVGVPNNYVLDQLFEDAVQSALKCDQQRKKDQYKKKSWRPGMDPSICYPPFYGIPTSVKQTIIMKGRQTHVGFVSKINPISDHDGLFMMMIRKMGLIPIVRTNVPQACKTIETNNNMFGYCKNPWNNSRTCGGSSGGQSGMVASYSAPIGFGSDIGGSIRIPAAFTGLVALKPHGRYSRQGNCYYGKFTGGIPTKSQLCPITRTVQDSILAINFLSNPQNYKDIPLQYLDPMQKYIPLDMQKIKSGEKYKIGIVRRLKYAKCSMANERALQRCIEILRSKGHQLVEVKFDKLEKLYFLFVNLFVFDQNLHIFSEFKGDQPLISEYKLFKILTKVPWLIKRIIMWFIAKKEPRLVQMLRTTKPLSNVRVLQKIYEIQKVYCARVYKTFAVNKLDAVVLPTFVTPAPILGQISNLQYFFSFTSAWNVLHYPVGTIPVTVVREDQKVFQDQFNDFYTKSVQKHLKNAEGLPVGIQIASTPYNEQKILNLMKQLQQQIKFRQRHRIRD